MHCRILVHKLTRLADFTLRASQHPKVTHLHHSISEFREERGAALGEQSHNLLASGVCDEGGVRHEHSSASQHIFVVQAIEMICRRVDEDGVGPVPLRAERLQEHGELLVHGRICVCDIVLSREVVQMREDPIAVGPSNGVCTCTRMQPPSRSVILAVVDPKLRRSERQNIAIEQ